MIWVAFALFLLATVYAGLHLSRLFGAVRADRTPGPRVRRRLLSRSLRAAGLWEWSVALFLTIEGQFWGAGIALWCIGAATLIASTAWGRSLALPHLTKESL